MEKLPPGWYTADSGERRYWDGGRWNKPSSQQDHLSDSTESVHLVATRRGGPRFRTIVLSSTGLALVVVVVVIFALVSQRPSVDAATIHGLEKTILADASSSYDKGELANGPITDVQCDPKTTTNYVTKFDCTAIYITDDNGISTGYSYKAEFNSQTSNYSWHLA